MPSNQEIKKPISFKFKDVYSVIYKIYDISTAEKFEKKLRVELGIKYKLQSKDPLELINYIRESAKEVSLQDLKGNYLGMFSDNNLDKDIEYPLLKEILGKELNDKIISILSDENNVLAAPQGKYSIEIDLRYPKESCQIIKKVLKDCLEYHSQGRNFIKCKYIQQALNIIDKIEKKIKGGDKYASDLLTIADLLVDNDISSAQNVNITTKYLVTKSYDQICAEKELAKTNFKVICEEDTPGNASYFNLDEYEIIGASALI